jgi:hypothetical protein
MKAGHLPVTCPCAACTRNTKTPKYSPTLTRHNSTNMAPIDDVLAAIKAQELGEQLVYQDYAKKYGVNRSTLSRRHRRVCCSRDDYASHKQVLTPVQEAGLVEYINRLTKQGLPPTREMIQNFSSALAPGSSRSRRLRASYTVTKMSLRRAGLLSLTANTTRLIPWINTSHTSIYSTRRWKSTTLSPTIPTIWMKRGL